MSSDLEKLDKELELVEHEMAQHPQETLMGLAEAVTLINQDTKQASEQISQAAEGLKQTPERITERVDSTIRETVEKLSHLEKEAREHLEYARKAADSTRKDAKRWGGWILGLSIFGGLGLITASYWHLNDAESRVSVLQAEFARLAKKINSERIRTLYGAEIEQNQNGTFIIFDETVKIGPCNLENCVSIEKDKRN